MTAPVWGCPWHGRVQGGQLLLPNGQSMAYPQPPAKYATVGGVGTAIPDTWGAAHRLAVPGVPEPVRSPEEQAGDTAAGRQWRNTAILSGSRLQLHGKPLDGWIYIDPDGARWRVRCTALDENTLHSFAAPLAGTLTLSRFGELGGAAESYNYAISCDWGLDGSDRPTSGRTLVDAIKPDGSAAIIMVHERKVIAFDPQIRWPHAFLELSIAGPGAAANVTCAVAKNRSAVASSTVDWPEPTAYWVGYYGGPPDYAVDDWRTQLQSDPTPPGEGNFWEFGGKSVGVYSGPVSVAVRRTLAIWYDDSGQRLDVDFVVAWNGTLDMPLPVEPGTVTQAGSASWTASIEVGGAVRSQVVGSWSATTTESPDSYTRSRTVVVDGQSYMDETSGGSGSSYIGLAYDAAEEWRLAFALEPAFVAEYATTFSYHLAVVRYSPQVIGLRADRPSGYAYHPPATPTGPAPGATTESDGSRHYGAWDPHGGGALWLQSTPVCYV